MSEHAEDLLRILIGGIPILLFIFGWFVKRLIGALEVGLETIREEVGGVKDKMVQMHDEVQMEIARLDKGLALLDKDVISIKEKLNGKIPPPKPRIKN